MGKERIEIYYYDKSGKGYDAGTMIDQADLFRFCCALVAPGTLAQWWDAYPAESLPGGVRSPESPEEAEQFMRHTRSEAVLAGLWPGLTI